MEHHSFIYCTISLFDTLFCSCTVLYKMERKWQNTQKYTAVVVTAVAAFQNTHVQIVLWERKCSSSIKKEITNIYV